ncbi:polyprenyl synthetase family protein [Nocardia sp. NPDC049149]|uniref:polyprenyl synthetase family protein n=1 Tax=Nocardia sp. NPDC049149 TaxID=3364315 RepID=UPI003715B1CC
MNHPERDGVIRQGSVAWQAATGSAGVLLDAAEIGSMAETLLLGFLDEQDLLAVELPELALFTGLLRDLIAAGGKRIRPQLCVLGWHAITCEPPTSAVWRVAASLELFHAFALIHDDVMDHSVLRRGRLTAHRVFAARYRNHRDADSLGEHAAILLGDIALGWSYELLHDRDSAPDLSRAVGAALNALRTETLIGQYLDLSATGCSAADLETAWRIIRLKTTKYTIERPLQLGALLAGAGRAQLETLSEYAIPLGDAFQLRDDLLGVFGDSGDTGKGTLDDLREGKHTVLMATAYQRATPAQTRLLRRYLGNPGLSERDADRIRRVVTDTGAREAVEQMIDSRVSQALAALDVGTLEPDAEGALRRLVHTAANRST